MAFLGETFLEKGTEAAAKKAVDGTAGALGFLVDKIKQWDAEGAVLFGDAFKRYLKTASMRYNRVRTLATGSFPRSIIGDDSIYVQVKVMQEVPVSCNISAPLEYHSHSVFSPEELLLWSTTNSDDSYRHLLILGSGGTGKSMLMRYLFLTAAQETLCVPVLLELRKLNAQETGRISIPDAIYKTMRDEFHAELSREQFDYSLNLGRYLFLLDGLDEVRDELFQEAVLEVRTLGVKYPKNACIVTSRERSDLVVPDTFATVRCMPLDRDQAVDLASKLWPEDDKTREFCRQLWMGLYERHRSFAENPLLLSILFLTFMRNSSIPEHLAEFYDKAYEALYTAHDRNDKGYYVREFRCKEPDGNGYLSEEKFKLIFGRFCFQTYFRQEYEFKKAEILSKLEECIHKLDMDGTSARDYLRDLLEAVCLIVRDGDVYRFNHRTFQAYFAAWYTSTLTDDQQKTLFDRVLYQREPSRDQKDYYGLLCQMGPKRAFENFLEKSLREIDEAADTSGDPNRYYLLAGTKFVSVGGDIDWVAYRRAGALTPDRYYTYRRAFTIELFRDHCIRTPIRMPSKAERNAVRRVISKIAASTDGPAVPLWDGLPRVIYTYDEADAADLTDKEREYLYRAMMGRRRIAEIRAGVKKWLKELDDQRSAPPSDTDDFLSGF